MVEHVSAVGVFSAAGLLSEEHVALPELHLLLSPITAMKTSGMLMIMSMLKQASSKAWLSSKLWLLEFEIMLGRKGCMKFE